MEIPNTTGCCKKEPQVLSALNDQEKAIIKLISLAEEVRSRVDAVLTPPDSVVESNSNEPPSPLTSPLSENIHSITDKAKYAHAILRDILDRLEI